jgi:vacuolar-type H+-ATPase subunit F/Vma7
LNLIGEAISQSKKGTDRIKALAVKILIFELQNLSVVSVGDSYFVTALRAAGVDGRVADSPKDAEEIVDTLVSEGRCKVIIVPERVGSILERKRDELGKRGIYYPIFAVVPGLDGEIGKERTKRLYELISQAVGARLKLGES